MVILIIAIRTVIHSNTTPRPGVPPRGLSCHQLFRVCLGFVWGLLSVFFLKGLGGFYHGFHEILFSRLT